MILGIDASNISSGGGLTHLIEVLRSIDPYLHGFHRVIVWSSRKTLNQISDKYWLYKVQSPLLEKSLPYRIFWQRFILKKLAEQASCDLLFVPGGSDISGFKPIVAMSQNLLPFESSEIKRLGISLNIIRLYLLRRTQIHTFRSAAGVIFLSKYGRDAVIKVSGTLSCKSTIISHGVNPLFFLTPRLHVIFREFSNDRPCRLLYVSIVDLYKHQWLIAEAVYQLRLMGIPITLEFIGPSGGGIKRLQEAINLFDPDGTFITYYGSVPYNELPEYYATADIGIFASTCESFGMILLEMMSAGLPIACSNRSAMPEILGNAGLYFDSEDI